MSEASICGALEQLTSPNEAEASAVDARQELDLKVGVAFTRFQTTFFHERFRSLERGAISYGPCQTPTLGFVVRRHVEMESFVPEPFWRLIAQVVSIGRGEDRPPIPLEWERGRLFDQEVACAFAARASASTSAVVRSVEDREERRREALTPATGALR